MWSCSCNSQRDSPAHAAVWWRHDPSSSHPCRTSATCATTGGPHVDAPAPSPRVPCIDQGKSCLLGDCQARNLQAMQGLQESHTNFQARHCTFTVMVEFHLLPYDSCSAFANCNVSVCLPCRTDSGSAAQACGQKRINMPCKQPV